MGTLYRLEEWNFQNFALLLGNHHVFIDKLAQLSCFEVDVEGEGRFTSGEREAVGQKEFVHPLHHIHHVSLPKVVLSRPRPPFSRYLRHQHLYPSEYCLKPMGFQLFLSESHKSLSWLVFVEVRITDVEEGNIVGQSFAKHYNQLQFAVEFWGLYLQHYGEAHPWYVFLRLVKEDWMLLGSPRLRVFVNERPIERADLLLLSL